tara:strand:- start:1200 stop:1340 length:141 start_codon:yes stop_codon:yes gene_type:complete
MKRAKLSEDPWAPIDATFTPTGFMLYITMIALAMGASFAIAYNFSG